MLRFECDVGRVLLGKLPPSSAGHLLVVNLFSAQTFSVLRSTTSPILMGETAKSVYAPKGGNCLPFEAPPFVA